MATSIQRRNTLRCSNRIQEIPDSIYSELIKSCRQTRPLEIFNMPITTKSSALSSTPSPVRQWDCMDEADGTVEALRKEVRQRKHAPAGPQLSCNTSYLGLSLQERHSAVSTEHLRVASTEALLPPLIDWSSPGSALHDHIEQQKLLTGLTLCISASKQGYAVKVGTDHASMTGTLYSATSTKESGTAPEPSSSYAFYFQIQRFCMLFAKAILQKTWPLGLI